MLPNPYILLGEIAAAIAIAFGAYLYGHHVESLVFDAYKAQQAAVAEKAVADSEAKVRAAENDANVKLTAISSSYQEQINALQKTRDTLTAAVDAGNKRLYVHVTRPSTNSVPATPAGGSSSDGETTAQLSPDTSRQLVDLAARADAIADQLAAAQAIIAQDRMTCNGD